MAAFVTRLQPDRLPGKPLVNYQTYRQLSGGDPSSTGDTRLRGALNGDSYRLAQSRASKAG